MEECRAREEGVGKLLDNLMQEVLNKMVEQTANVLEAKASGVEVMDGPEVRLARDRLGERTPLWTPLGSWEEGV